MQYMGVNITKYIQNIFSTIYKMLKETNRVLKITHTCMIFIVKKFKFTEVPIASEVIYIFNTIPIKFHTNLL